MVLGVAVDGAATSCEFAADLVLTTAVGRCFARLIPPIKVESMFGTLGDAEAVALSSRDNPEIPLLLGASFAALF